MISSSLLEAILQYLATKPYKEVYTLIQSAQQEIAQTQVQAAQTEEKGED
tara:strand:+ start:714 stop:863 length:150 start_codon:yes stop_codon:yes gene_type:complete